MRSSLQEKYKLLQESGSGNSQVYWLAMKISIVTVWLGMITKVLSSYGASDHYNIVCRLLFCQSLALGPVKIIAGVLAFVFSYLYVREWKMKFSCLALALLSMSILSFEESQGIRERTAIVSAVFAVQAIAYILCGENSKRAVAFSLQIVAATYTLAGLSKILNSGFLWFADARYLLLQIRKGGYYNFFDTGNPGALEDKVAVIEYFTAHPWVLQVLLFMTIVIEISAGLLLINRRFKLVYSILLIFLHIGIYLVLDIVIFSIQRLMIIILINPLYYMLVAAKASQKKWTWPQNFPQAENQNANSPEK